MGYKVVTINKSKTQWHCHYWHCPDSADFTVTSTPASDLAPGTTDKPTQTTLDWYTHGGLHYLGLGGTNDYADGQVVWTAPNGKAFGVYIHVPLQILFMGTRPYYRVKYEADSGWSGESFENDYDFDKNVLGFVVEVRNVMPRHTTISLEVTIKDL